MTTTPTPADHDAALNLWRDRNIDGHTQRIAEALADARAEGREQYRDRVLGATVRTLDELRAAVVTLERLGDLR